MQAVCGASCPVPGSLFPGRDRGTWNQRPSKQFQNAAHGSAANGAGERSKFCPNMVALYGRNLRAETTNAFAIRNASPCTADFSKPRKSLQSGILEVTSTQDTSAGKCASRTFANALQHCPSRDFHSYRKGVSACTRSSTKTLATLDSVPTLERPQTNTSFNQGDFEVFLLDLQRQICNEAEAADGSGAKFCEDKWSRGPDPKAG